MAGDRHPSTQHLLWFFEHVHLSEPLNHPAAECKQLAERMTELIPDGPELTAGLRKLLEAKDCFVRALLPDASQE
jgi:hypothetical protein